MSAITKRVAYYDGPVVNGTVFYIPIGFNGAHTSSLTLMSGDGTCAGTGVVEHTDCGNNPDGSAVDNSVGATSATRAGDARVWKDDTQIGNLVVVAATDATGSVRETWSNQPRLHSRVRFTPTASGRLIVWGQGQTD